MFALPVNMYPSGEFFSIFNPPDSSYSGFRRTIGSFFISCILRICGGTQISTLTVKSVVIDMVAFNARIGQAKNLSVKQKYFFIILAHGIEYLLFFMPLCAPFKMSETSEVFIVNLSGLSLSQ